MTDVFPEGVASEGNLKVVYVPDIVDLTAPTDDELNAAGAVDLTMYIKTLAAAIDQGQFDDRRLGSRETFPAPGRVTRNPVELTYVYAPQAAPATAGNKAYDTLKLDVEGFLVWRWGMANEGAFVAAQIVTAGPVRCGGQFKVPPDTGNNEGEKLSVSQKIYYTGPVKEDVDVVAAP